MDNLYRDLPARLDAERIDTILTRPGARIERIVSTGQATPEGEWLEQGWDEWVLLVTGAARLEFENSVLFQMLAGDHLLIPAGTRHRVAWTDTDHATVWLAVHFGG